MHDIACESHTNDWLVLTTKHASNKSTHRIAEPKRRNHHSDGPLGNLVDFQRESPVRGLEGGAKYRWAPLTNETSCIYQWKPKRSQSSPVRPEKQ
jgi:hypothetical protein